MTVHVGVGYDITHEHPNCDGAAYGAGSYRDFLIYTKSVESLEGGIMVSLGSAIMGPEVYLKALAMATQRRPTGRAPDHRLHDCGLRPWCRSRATCTESSPRAIPATTSGHTRPFWCGPWRTVARACTFAAITASRFRPCGGLCRSA